MTKLDRERLLPAFEFWLKSAGNLEHPKSQNGTVSLIKRLTKEECEKAWTFATVQPLIGPSEMTTLPMNLPANNILPGDAQCFQ